MTTTTPTSTGVARRPRLPKGITRAEILRYGELDLQRKDIAKEHGLLNAKIKQVFTEVGIWIVGNVVVKRTQAHALDTEALEARFPLAKFPEFYTQVIDTTRIPADVLDQFRTITVERLAVDVVRPLPQTGTTA